MDVHGNHGSEDGPAEQTLTARLPEWARERENGQWYGEPAAAQSSQQAKSKAPTRLIVVVPDEGGDGWAKARVFDDPGEAAALVEMLVQDGLAQEGVSVFSATQMVVDVAYKPLVELKESLRKEEPPE